MHNTELKKNLYIRLGVKVGRDLVVLTKLDKNLFRHCKVGETNAVYLLTYLLNGAESFLRS